MCILDCCFCVFVFFVFFFFKQKTAYEMRISDWSSDVCSSDLCPCRHRQAARCRVRQGRAGSRPPPHSRKYGANGSRPSAPPGWRNNARRRLPGLPARRRAARRPPPSRDFRVRPRPTGRRSEEHTSELQSLMRISYAVFCLKKKKKEYTTRTRTCKWRNETREH